MKNKILRFMFSMCLIVPCMFMLTACADHTHTLTKVDVVAETCTTDGNTLYYKCGCGKYFSDKEAKTEIEKDSWIVAKTGHTYSNDWTRNESQHWQACECGDKNAVVDHSFGYDGVCDVCSYDSETLHVGTVEELNTAFASGGAIKILEDIDLGDFTGDKLVVAEGVSVSIDLNGKTIKGRNSNELISSALITNNGTLVINDSSANKTGKIYMTDTGTKLQTFAHGIFTINNQGNLVINGGTIENAGTTDVPYAIDNNSTIRDISFTLNGGNIVAHITAIRLFATSTTKENKVVIESGTVTGGFAGIWVQQINAGALKAELVINGGIIEGGTASGVFLVVNNDDNGGAVSLKITDGVIKNNSKDWGTVALYDRVGPTLSSSSVHVEITGGTFYNENIDGFAFICDRNRTVDELDAIAPENVSITGGSFSSDPSDEISTATGWQFYNE